MNLKQLMKIKDAADNRPWKNSALTQEDVDKLLQMNDYERMNEQYYKANGDYGW